MSWVNDAGPGDADSWVWIDDGQGNPDQPGDNTPLPPGTGSMPQPTDPSGGGGGDLGTFLQGILGQGGGNPTALSQILKSMGLDANPNILAALTSIIPAMKMSDQMNQNADTYMKKGEQYAGMLDPFGSQRGQYQQKLAALEADPSSIVNTPGYKFSLDQGLKAVANQDVKRFGYGSGAAGKDYMDYAQGLASKTYNDTISQLSQLSGSQFGPQGSGVLSMGLQGSLNSKLAALAAKLTPFGIINAPVPGGAKPAGTQPTAPGVAPPPGVTTPPVTTLPFPGGPAPAPPGEGDTSPPPGETGPPPAPGFTPPDFGGDGGPGPDV